jgi:hypothetical protein
MSYTCYIKLEEEITPPITSGDTMKHNMDERERLNRVATLATSYDVLQRPTAEDQKTKGAAPPGPQ